MKSFIIRLLQVIWVLSAIFATFGIIAHSFDGYLEGLAVTVFSFFAWSVFLIVFQYLIFAKLDPRRLFNGSLNKKKS